MSRWVTIVGSSARAAACSAVRAGFFVRAADRFADVDLQHLAQTTQLVDYPRGLAAVLGESHPGAWLYTGGLENQPGLIRVLARQRPLWGNSAEVLRLVRDPARVSAQLRAAGLFAPEVWTAPEPPPADGTWMRKPRRSAGGTHVQVWNQRSSLQPVPRRTYYQQYIPGPSYSAAYVACRGQAQLLGITRQLVGEAWTGAAAWQYCGSVGPWYPPPALRDQFQRIGDSLANWASLCGLFGVDAIVNEQGVWPIEVNPRYTASMEVLERAGNFSAIALHAAACQDPSATARPGSEPATLAFGQRPACHGKAIWFARHSLRMAGRLQSLVDRQVASSDDPGPAFADVPVPDSRLQSGWPVLSVFAAAESDSEVLRQLRTRLELLQSAARPEISA